MNGISIDARRLWSRLMDMARLASCPTAMMGSGVHCGVATFDETLAICDAAGKVIGVVTGGQAIRWYEITITGEETHAGPVPMDMRRDPVPTLARVIELAYRIGATGRDARCTIGKIQTVPGSINVVPGRITLTVDLRHPDETALDVMEERFRLETARLDIHAGVRVAVEPIWRSPAVTFDPGLVSQVRESALSRGYPARDLVSGAGYDAFHLSRVAPSSMIVIPCHQGISHNERESAKPDHVAAEANVLLDIVLARTTVRRAAAEEPA